MNYAALKALSDELKRPLETLIALARMNDPFFAGIPSRRAGAEWFAALWERLQIKHGSHLRAIHYKIVSQPEPVLNPLGLPYHNTQEDWARLNVAQRDAVYLGLVPSDALVDRRNDEPIIYLSGTASPGLIMPLSWTPSVEVDQLPEAPSLPRLVLQPPTLVQPYHLEIWAEKTTMNDVLLPIGQRFGVNIVTGTGELSGIRCRQFVRRARESERPVSLTVSI